MVGRIVVTNDYDVADYTGKGEVEIQVGGDDGENLFEPDAIVVDAGTTVNWEWESGNHNIVPTEMPDDCGWEGVEDRYEPEYDHEWTFDVPGRYGYVCTPHEDDGMAGMIFVLDDRTDEDVVEISVGGDDGENFFDPEFVKIDPGRRSTGTGSRAITTSFPRNTLCDPTGQVSTNGTNLNTTTCTRSSTRCLRVRLHAPRRRRDDRDSLRHQRVRRRRLHRPGGSRDSGRRRRWREPVRPGCDHGRRWDDGQLGVGIRQSQHRADRDARRLWLGRRRGSVRTGVRSRVDLPGSWPLRLRLYATRRRRDGRDDLRHGRSNRRARDHDRRGRA